MTPDELERVVEMIEDRIQTLIRISQENSGDKLVVERCNARIEELQMVLEEVRR